MNIKINIEDIKKACHKIIDSPLEYIDNGSKILAVAHMDSVQFSSHFRVTGDRVYCPKLDNRIGVYIITSLLPQMGIITDILLTTGEESGMSTAMFFEPHKEYNWIVEFDRTGTDVVLYDYYGAKIINALEYCGFDIGHGSYTDICEMEHLGVKGFNVGIGMYDYHSLKSYVNLSEMKGSIEKFSRFYDAFSDTKFQHEPYWYNDYWNLMDSDGPDEEYYWDEIDKNCHDIWWEENENEKI